MFHCSPSRAFTCVQAGPAMLVQPLPLPKRSHVFRCRPLYWFLAGVVGMTVSRRVQRGARMHLDRAPMDTSGNCAIRHGMSLASMLVQPPQALCVQGPATLVSHFRLGLFRKQAGIVLGPRPQNALPGHPHAPAGCIFGSLVRPQPQFFRVHRARRCLNILNMHAVEMTS